MNPQITKNEVDVLEALRIHGTTKGVLSATGYASFTVYTHLRTLMKLGLVSRSGVKGSYRFKALDGEYEIRGNRGRPKPAPDHEEGSDSLIELSLNVDLNEDQKFYLAAHRRSTSRRVLAERLGLTKLQLNFLLMKIGGRP
ncbi:hypothetical protein PM3016_5459 [Paenibacillus mucilaginosus 3016]|uniref:Uncharacterized protein n=1 Tax=Paenibacillus mucilaginosus 3016 TaxID=1116391 RepID=H6NDW0_9BACL|nr:hypothetical protein [Paenibacillus mucilaginosus]AFC32159.1 hypothetical protein PM3016_5459 [Paenibacillus mucilaginosus 3016]WFA20659.1 hypothetical protein ERY13_27170 [Paenibacillus mucilaginosus]